MRLEECIGGNTRVGLRPELEGGHCVACSESLRLIKCISFVLSFFKSKFKYTLSTEVHNPRGNKVFKRHKMALSFWWTAVGSAATAVVLVTESIYITNLTQVGKQASRQLASMSNTQTLLCHHFC